MHRGYPAAHFLLVIVDSTITRRNCDPGPHGRRAMSSQAARPGEREFLAAYRSAEYPGFAVAVDLAIFTIRSGPLCALLVQRGEHPYRGYWALPGGFVRSGESVEEAAWRELAEETGEATFSGHLEQLRTYGDPGRDPRMRGGSVAHDALAPSRRRARTPGGGAGGGGGRGCRAGGPWRPRATRRCSGPSSREAHVRYAAQPIPGMPAWRHRRRRPRRRSRIPLTDRDPGQIRPVRSDRLRPRLRADRCHNG